MADEQFRAKLFRPCNRVLVAAFTFQAAYNAGVMTIHSSRGLAVAKPRRINGNLFDGSVAAELS